MVSTKTLQVNRLLASLPKCNGYLIAYSGGADSSALLHLFADTANVRAIHINHHLQADASDWQQHCQKTCNDLGIPLIIEQAQLADSSENAARIARYALFNQHLNSNEILLTAHHAQDQSETILLKLLRGTGIKGLCGIAKLQKFAQGYLARPLLGFSPQILKKYLLENKLNWIEDSSNQDSSYKRNYIRNEILPGLLKSFPDGVDNISRSGNNIRQSYQLLQHLLNFDDRYLCIDTLLSVPDKLRTTLFYHWLSSKNLPLPDQKALSQICNDFIHAKKDKNPHFANKYYQLSRWQHAIYCIKPYQQIGVNHSFQWNTSLAFVLPNKSGVLSYVGTQNLNFIIKFNQTGQKLKPANSQCTRPVKKLFQQHKVPPWQRHNTPFIYHNNTLVSLGYSWSHMDKYLTNIVFKPQNILIRGEATSD